MGTENQNMVAYLNMHAIKENNYWLISTAMFSKILFYEDPLGGIAVYLSDTFTEKKLICRIDTLHKLKSFIYATKVL